jgi:hypothetical protein
MDARVLHDLVEAEADAVGAVGRGGEAEDPAGLDRVVDVAGRVRGVVLALVADKEVDVGGWIPLEEADGDEIDPNTVAKVLGSRLVEEVAAHRHPSDPGSGAFLEGFGDVKAADGLPAAGRGLNHHRPGGGLEFIGTVAVLPEEHGDSLVDESLLVGAERAGRRGEHEHRSGRGKSSAALPCGSDAAGRKHCRERSFTTGVT